MDEKDSDLGATYWTAVEARDSIVRCAATLRECGEALQRAAERAGGASASIKRRLDNAAETVWDAQGRLRQNVIARLDASISSARGLIEADKGKLEAAGRQLAALAEKHAPALEVIADQVNRVEKDVETLQGRSRSVSLGDAVASLQTVVAAIRGEPLRKVAEVHEAATKLAGSN